MFFAFRSRTSAFVFILFISSKSCFNTYASLIYFGNFSALYQTFFLRKICAVSSVSYLNCSATKFCQRKKYEHTSFRNTANVFFLESESHPFQIAHQIRVNTRRFYLHNSTRAVLMAYFDPSQAAKNCNSYNSDSISRSPIQLKNRMKNLYPALFINDNKVALDNQTHKKNDY